MSFLASGWTDERQMPYKRITSKCLSHSDKATKIASSFQAWNCKYTVGSPVREWKPIPSATKHQWESLIFAMPLSATLKMLISYGMPLNQR